MFKSSIYIAATLAAIALVAPAGPLMAQENILDISMTNLSAVEHLSGNTLAVQVMAGQDNEGDRLLETYFQLLFEY